MTSITNVSLYTSRLMLDLPLFVSSSRTKAYTALAIWNTAIYHGWGNHWLVAFTCKGMLISLTHHLFIDRRHAMGLTVSSESARRSPTPKKQSQGCKICVSLFKGYHGCYHLKILWPDLKGFNISHFSTDPPLFLSHISSLGFRYYWYTNSWHQLHIKVFPLKKKCWCQLLKYKQ